jgi:hypothetical protein
MIENPFQSPQSLEEPEPTSVRTGGKGVVWVLRSAAIIFWLVTAYCVLMSGLWLYLELKQDLPAQRSLIGILFAPVAATIAFVLGWLAKRT